MGLTRLTAPELVSGHTFHGRTGAVKNAFRYGVDLVLCDLSSDHDGPRLFSRNRRNLVSLYDCDHGGARDQGHGAQWVERIIQDRPLGSLEIGQVLLLAQARFLGHVFNPVSFWLVFDTSRTLRLVIAEVNNTFGDRHSYLCHHDDLRAIEPSDRLRARKLFHVSPFQDVSGDYTFRFDIRDDRIGIVIDYQGEGVSVYTTLHGRRRKMTNWGLLQSALRRPFGSRRVLALIHWQALKLWLKGAAYRPPAPSPRSEVS